MLTQKQASPFKNKSPSAMRQPEQRAANTGRVQQQSLWHQGILRQTARYCGLSFQNFVPSDFGMSMFCNKIQSKPPAKPEVWSGPIRAYYWQAPQGALNFSSLAFSALPPVNGLSPSPEAFCLSVYCLSWISLLVFVSVGRQTFHLL